MQRSQSILVKLSTLALVASVAAPGAFAAKAKKAADKKAAPATEAKVEIDPAASVLKWEGKKVTGQHNGQIKLKSGSLVMSGKELKGGEFVVDMTSISDEDLKDAEYNKKLITHLSSEDFFNVAKYPTAVLKIKSVKSVEGFTGPTFEVTGDLTIKDKTNEVKFPAMVKTADGKTTATANITIDRTKWDIKYGSGKFFTGLGDKVIYDDFKFDVALASK
ncbi:MAG: YceI family protein [Bdellovibrionales bacterium]|nr:YceI family protein [Bdellovibrionales bacterium]